MEKLIPINHDLSCNIYLGIQLDFFELIYPLVEST